MTRELSTMTPATMTPATLLSLMQLANPTLPVGAYSYSEGLETLVETQQVTDADTLQQWLTAELRYGGLKLEGAMVARAHRTVGAQHWDELVHWNHWWSAARETKELRQQSWQMGRSLSRLLGKIDPTTDDWLRVLRADSDPVNWAIAFGGAAAHWQIDLNATMTAFYQSWAGNLINAGVKLIPLGQTAGQQLLFNLTPCIIAAVTDVLKLKDDELRCCSWGVALASSQHETQRVRLFQS